MKGLFHSQSAPLFQPTTTPTPTDQITVVNNPTFPPINPSDTTKHKPLTITNISPSNGQKNVPINTAINVSFDQSVLPADVPFSISPNSTFTVSTKENVLTIQPKNPLIPGTAYIIVFRIYDIHNQLQLPQYTFTTAGQKPTSVPTINPNQRVQDPADAFLYHYTPYYGSDFTVTSDFDQSLNHYFFTVTLKGDQNTAKNDFINWLTSLQLTNSQIQSLDVRYQ